MLWPHSLLFYVARGERLSTIFHWSSLLESMLYPPESDLPEMPAPSPYLLVATQTQVLEPSEALKALHDCTSSQPSHLTVFFICPPSLPPTALLLPAPTFLHKPNSSQDFLQVLHPTKFSQTFGHFLTLLLNLKDPFIPLPIGPPSLCFSGLSPGAIFSWGVFPCWYHPPSHTHLLFSTALSSHRTPSCLHRSLNTLRWNCLHVHSLPCLMPETCLVITQDDTRL